MTMIIIIKTTAIKNNDYINNNKLKQYFESS